MSRILNTALSKASAPRVVIIKGNPAKMVGQEQVADTYYRSIADYVTKKGFDVSFDDGEPMTCPDLNVVFWIAHSRGVERIRCIDAEEHWRFLKFGVVDGVIHPKDAQWQKSIADHKSSTEQPPKEHFEFTKEQKRAIDDLVTSL